MWALAMLLGLAGVHADAQATVRFAGSTAVGASAPGETVTLAITRTGAVGSVHVRTAGSDGYDFAAVAGGTCAPGSLLLVGQQCTVSIAFSPKAPGERRGAVVVLDVNGQVLGSRLLVATATGPLGVFVPGTIGTVAGDSVWIYSGDGGAAVGSAIFLPFGVAVNAAGDLYIADSSNARIRKVDAVTGVISTVAGVGNVGSLGDGGLASQALVSNPSSVLLDAAGNLYFADTGNNAIRRVSAFDGTLSTVAGTLGRSGLAGDGLQATAALLNGPNGIAFDAAGDLLIADSGNNVVRMVGTDGNIRTIAGRGNLGYSGDGGPATASSLNAPWSVTVSAAGEILIADQGNHAIRKIDLNGTISTVVGTGIPGFRGDGGPATAAQLNAPASVVVDAAGNLYVADSGNNRVRKVSAATGLIDTIAGSDSQAFFGDYGAANVAGLYGPYTLALDSQGDLLIADVFHNRIRKISSNAATLKFAPMRVGRVSAVQTQTLENDGNAPLNVGSVMPVSQAQVDAPSTTCNTGTQLAPLGTCVVGVAFAPTTVATLDFGSVNVASDASNSPGVLTLAGQVLSIDPAGASLTSNLNPSTTGDAVVLTATVTSAGTTPTGTVTLLDGNSVITTKQLGAGGIALFNINTLTGGQHTLTVSYSGDSNNTAAVSPPLVQVVQEVVAATTTTIASSAPVVDAGGSLRLVAGVQVATAGTGSGAITGSVSFKDGSSVLGTATVVNGTATLNVSTLAVGQHTLVAVFNGSPAYSASTSPMLSEKVQLATAKVLLSTSLNPSSAGAPLTLSANLTSTGGTPTGAVTFLDGSTTLGSANASAAGVATLAVAGPDWTVGTHTLTASYAGDVNDSAAVSPAFSESIHLAQTTVTLVSSLSPAGQGAPVVFNATVTGNGGIPGGSVQVLEGATLVASGTLNAAGVATLSSANLPLGSHTLQAVYAGDTYDAPSQSAPLLQVVNNATTVVSLAASANPSLFGNPLLLTVTVAGTGSVPSGTVNFTDGATSLGTATLDAKGNATLSTTNLGIGTHTLVAIYAGDSNHTGLGSAPVVETVLQGTATTLVAAAPRSVAGRQVLLVAVVTGSNGKAVTGAVTILDGTTPLFTATPDATGHVSLNTATLAPGQHTLAASFAGDSTDAASSSPAQIVTVDLAVTSTAITSSGAQVNSGAPLTLTAVVSGNGGTPGGTVSFRDGATLLGTAPLNASGSGSLTLSTLLPGVHGISATYNGDTNDGGSLSATLSEQVTLKTVVAVSSSANPSLLEDSVRISISVANGLPGSVPTGLVTLTDGGSTLGSAALDAGGLASFTLSAPVAGTHMLLATYAGDSANLPATSAPLLQVVNLRPTVSTFTVSSTSISAGQQIILVAVVQGSGSRAPGGSFSFASGGTVLATAPINAAGVATATVTPGPAAYNAVATYSGDALFASSAAPAIPIVVGPTVEFTLAMQPSSVTLKSGQHGALTVSIASANTFSDTLALGCAGLPASATCTFSLNQIPLSGGISKTVTVTVDTGNPLGAGATVSQLGAGRSGVLACMLPAGGLLAWLLIGRRRAGAMLGRYRLGGAAALLTLLLMLGGATALTGCGSNLNVVDTPAGNYTFQIVGTGNVTGATQRGTVQLTVTP